MRPGLWATPFYWGINVNALIITLVAGSLGGNLSGVLFRNLNLGLLRNAAYGALGGVLGEFALGGFATTAGPLAIILAAMIGGAAMSALLGVVFNLVDR